MKKTVLLLSTSLLAVICSCHKQPEQDAISFLPESHTIPIEQALSTMSSFLMDNSMGTKAYAISSGDYDVKSWNIPKFTKSVEGGDLLYCVKFTSDGSGAVLAADDRLPESIYCITDADAITVEELNAALDYLQHYNPEDSINSPDDLEEMGEEMIPRMIVNDVLKHFENRRDDDYEQIELPDYLPSCGPYLTTQWSQKEPFNNLMNGTDAGCCTIATAQVILYHRKALNPSMNYEGKVCDWNSLLSVKNSSWQASPEALDQVAHFVLSVKNECGIATSHTSGCYWNVEDALKAFGFRSVSHDFSHFGGSDHNNNHLYNVSRMLSQGKPVIVLAFDINQFVGHTFVIDGYKSGWVNNSMKLLYHINWGWRNGKSNGYYVSGVFNTSQRVERAADDPLDSISDNSNFDLTHYYIYYEI